LAVTGQEKGMGREGKEKRGFWFQAKKYHRSKGGKDRKPRLLCWLTSHFFLVRSFSFVCSAFWAGGLGLKMLLSQKRQVTIPTFNNSCAAWFTERTKTLVSPHFFLT
jgi:hypothetical protein